MVRRGLRSSARDPEFPGVLADEDRAVCARDVRSVLCGACMNCLICGKKVELIPSAAERAKKFGGKPEEYTAIFRMHAQCVLEQRKAEVLELIAKHYA